MYRMMIKVPQTKEYLESLDINSVDDYYRKSTTEDDCLFYIDMSIVWPTIEELKEIMHKNNGLIFLAHPTQYKKYISPEELLEITSGSIDGIEISNKTGSVEEIEFLYDYAKENNLLISAGSNFHGNHEESKVGAENLTPEMKQDIIKWIENHL